MLVQITRNISDNEINKYFEENLVKTLENSYFDYSLINLSMYQQDKTKYLKSMAGCSNLIRKYLFHGTQIDPISKIITTGFAYARKAFFGMGVYLEAIYFMELKLILYQK